jgi:2-polyprenyl-3-methyl-5-hydroxy-6-metoxy-1,4-benzoquinol methylase
MSKAEKDWEKFGRTNPYYAVATLDKFKEENLNDSSKENFFITGEEYTQKIWQVIEKNFIPDFYPQKAIDFGCGVGRLILPMAKRSGQITGVDISENMLKEGRINAQNAGLKNIDFIKDGDKILKLNGQFDFIHSFVVFQHIKPEIGEIIFQKFVKMLSPGGIGVLHFAYSNSKSSLGQKFRFKLYRDFSWIHKIRNVVLRKENEQFMPMYFYNLNRLFLILQENNCHNCQVRFTHHGMEGIILFFQKRSEDLF